MPITRGRLLTVLPDSGRPVTDTDARQPPVTYRVYSDRQTVTTKNSIAN